MIKSLPFLLILSLIACCIEVDISVPSFPDISDHFAISDGLTQMTIAVNFFGFFLSGIFYGPLSECYGRRSIMIVGNTLLLIGAAGCVFAPSIEFLLFSRLIQGIGASASAVIVFAMIADVYTGTTAAKLVGKMNSILTIFMSIAPIAGGFINEMVGWRGNYFVVALVSSLALLLLYLYLPETKKDPEKLSIKKAIGDYMTLMTDKSFLYASIVPSVGYAGYMSFIACGSFLYMETYGLPIMQYALHQGAIVVSFSIVSMYSGALSQKIGRKNSIIYGIIISLIGGIMMIIVGFTTENAPYLTTISMILFSSGAAVYYPVVFTRSMEIFPELKGSSSSVIMGMRMILLSAFITFTSCIYNGKLLPVALIVFLAAILVIICTYRLLNFVSFEEKEA
jgi:DHA1 family bicyclomycin/chloramphenicol resistance-like MFS transporter